MDFKKRLIEELKLTKLQVDTMYNDYVEVCEKLAKQYHKEQLALHGVNVKAKVVNIETNIGDIHL